MEKLLFLKIYSTGRENGPPLQVIKLVCSLISHMVGQGGVSLNGEK